MIEEKQWISSEILFSAIKEQLAAGRQAAFTVTGMSMWPFLCHGRDQAIVGRVERKDLRKGDVVLYQTPEGKYILHRITGLKENTFQTTGDGNLFRDREMPYESVAARMESAVRKGRKISCGSIKWRLPARIWRGLFPVRRILLPLLKLLSRLRHLQICSP